MSEKSLAPISLKPAFSSSMRGELAELSVEVYRQAGALERVVPGERTRREIAKLLAGMNSYYSNLIEGVKTYPLDVDAALADDFSTRPDDRNRQELARAHIETEGAMRERLSDDAGWAVHSLEFLRWLHAEFYEGLPEGLRVTETQSGKVLPVVPGEFRDRGVTIGKHRPPAPGEIESILDEFGAHFSSGEWLATEQLALAAAAHHRVAWVHPFLDGNGRVARLYSHACLIRAKVDGAGLWSLSRGLARNRQGYYDALAAADKTEPFEGRHRLSGAGLDTFARYFLETLLDQIRFMNDLLELPAVTRRMEAFVRYELAPKKHGEALARLLKAIFVEGEMARGEVKLVTGLRDTAAREVINLAFKHGLVQSPSPKGKLALAFPAAVLEAYFPRLYLDLPV